MSEIDRLAAALRGLAELAPTLEQLPEQVRASMAAARDSAQAQALLAVVDEGLYPDRVYTFEQAVRLTGRTRKTLSNQPEAMLPAVKSRGRAIGFRGVDLMAYRGDISHEEARAYKAAQREAVTRAIHQHA